MTSSVAEGFEALAGHRVKNEKKYDAKRSRARFGPRTESDPNRFVSRTRQFSPDKVLRSNPGHCSALG
jgi:hypothetical protein